MPASTVQVGKTYVMNGLGRAFVTKATQRHVDFEHPLSHRKERMARGKVRDLIVSEYVPLEDRT